MNITENPIFLTQKRLTYRSGVLAAILIAALIGLSLLSGMIANLTDPHAFHFQSPQEAGKMFYGWVLGVEILVLVIGGFSKISRVLADDRKAGLWDSNRLTPLKPAAIVTGYWFGSALREVYMGAVLAVIGLVIILLAQLPVTLWLGTQVLVLSTTLFFGLLALLAGMAFQRPQSSMILLLPFFFLLMFSLQFTKLSIINFLLPIYGIVNLFSVGHDPASDWNPWQDWSAWPGVFGLPVPPVLLCLGLQFALGIFLWRATVRKTANPFQPLLLRWEAIAIFALLIAAQHGLVWGIWHGQYGNPQDAGETGHEFRSEPVLAIVHGGTILVGVLILALASPLPERVRVEALRTGMGSLRLIFSRSAVSLALALAAVAVAASLTHFIFSFRLSGIAWGLAAGNLLVFFLMFSLLLEYCRLRFKRRSLGFVALWLFVLCVLPFILAGVFSNEALAKLSFLAPGTVALSGEDGTGMKYLAGWTFVHFCVVVLLLIGWLRHWKILFVTSQPIPPAR